MSLFSQTSRSEKLAKSVKSEKSQSWYKIKGVRIRVHICKHPFEKATLKSSITLTQSLLPKAISDQKPERHFMGPSCEHHNIQINKIVFKEKLLP